MDKAPDLGSGDCSFVVWEEKRRGGVLSLKLLVSNLSAAFLEAMRKGTLLSDVPALHSGTGDTASWGVADVTGIG